MVMEEIRGLDPGRSDLVELMRKGCGYLCTEEWALYRDFFGNGEDGDVIVSPQAGYFAPLITRPAVMVSTCQIQRLKIPLPRWFLTFFKIFYLVGAPPIPVAPFRSAFG